MRSSEEIIKALRCCAKYMDEGLCEECPLSGQDDCGERVLLDAAGAIENLERQLEELEQQLDYGKEAMDVLVKENLTMEKKLTELRKGRAPCVG